MDGAEILESLLLGQDEDHGVVAVSTAGMDRNGGWLVHHHQVLRHGDHRDMFVRHGNLVSAKINSFMYCCQNEFNQVLNSFQNETLSLKRLTRDGKCLKLIFLLKSFQYDSCHTKLRLI